VNLRIVADNSNSFLSSANKLSRTVEYIPDPLLRQLPDHSWRDTTLEQPALVKSVSPGIELPGKQTGPFTGFP
jgi:hypothetical protein